MFIKLKPGRELELKRDVEIVVDEPSTGDSQRTTVTFVSNTRFVPVDPSLVLCEDLDRGRWVEGLLVREIWRLRGEVYPKEVVIPISHLRLHMGSSDEG